MFFILSKVLYFLIQPLNWIVGFLLYAVFGKHPIWKKRLRNWGVILLLFFTNHFILNLFMLAWETDMKPVNSIEAPYDIGILLGGYSTFYKAQTDRHHFNPQANRLTQTLELYKRGKIKKILLTGGSGELLTDSPSEALLVKDWLMLMNIPEVDIIVEPNSRNTYENAVFTADLLQSQFPNAKCLLITSAFHMRRARACFKKAGVDFQTFSVSPIGERIRWVPAMLFIPNRDCFHRWEVLIKELFGYTAYWLRGYI